MSVYRVALVHSYYSSAEPSGENLAVLAQAEALRAAGHDVSIVKARTDDLSKDPLYAARAAVRVATKRGRSPLAALKRLSPDIVHVHNLFPNFGSAWVWNWPGPLVATVHNYRPLCAAGALVRNGQTCTACPDGDRWAGVRHACYRQSRLATLPLAWASRRGAVRDDLLSRANQVIVLSELSRRIYAQRLGDARLAVVPNFADLEPRTGEDRTGARRRWGYVGRVSEEKGILPLLRRWPPNVPLDVVGTGPLLQECQRVAPASVVFHGLMARDELRTTMQAWRGLVFPSIAFETCGLVYLEALAAGVPVLAFPGSSVADMVQADGTGVVTRWDEPLADMLSRGTQMFDGLGDHCRVVYERQYSKRRWLAQMADVYGTALLTAVNDR